MIKKLFFVTFKSYIITWRNAEKTGTITVFGPTILWRFLFLPMQRSSYGNTSSKIHFICGKRILTSRRDQIKPAKKGKCKYFCDNWQIIISKKKSERTSLVKYIFVTWLRNEFFYFNSGYFHKNGLLFLFLCV